MVATISVCFPNMRQDQLRMTNLRLVEARRTNNPSDLVHVICMISSSGDWDGEFVGPLPPELAAMSGEGRVSGTRGTRQGGEAVAYAAPLNPDARGGGERLASQADLWPTGGTAAEVEVADDMMYNQVGWHIYRGLPRAKGEGEQRSLSASCWHSRDGIDKMCTPSGQRLTVATDQERRQERTELGDFRGTGVQVFLVRANVRLDSQGALSRFCLQQVSSTIASVQIRFGLFGCIIVPHRVVLNPPSDVREFSFEFPVHPVSRWCSQM